MVTRVNNTVLYTGKLKEEILNVLTTARTTKWQLCEVMGVSTNLTVVVILQYTHINISDHHIVYNILSQFYLRKTGERNIWVLMLLHGLQ